MNGVWHASLPLAQDMQGGTWHVMTSYISDRLGNIAAPQQLASLEITKGMFDGSQPSITGNPWVGETLTAQLGDWVPADAVVEYSWYSTSGTSQEVKGTTYTLTSDDVGHRINLSVIVSKPGYETWWGHSEFSHAILPTQDIDPPQVIEESVSPDIWNIQHGQNYAYIRLVTEDISGTAVPSITVRHEDGQVLHSGPMEADGKQGTREHWRSANLKIPQNKVGVWTVTRGPLEDAAGNREAPGTYTLGTITVVEEPLLERGEPQIRGTFQVGSTLTIDPGAWGPGDVDLKYQWTTGYEQPIPGATADSLTLTPALMNRYIGVQVTATKPGYWTEVIDVPGQSVVPGEIRLLEGLKLVGTPAVGQILRLSPIRVAADLPVEASNFVWMVNGSYYRTAPYLVLTESMVGKKITAHVRLSAEGYESKYFYSTPAGPVQFKDVLNPSLWYYQPVYWMAERGITAGYSDGTFKPSRSITRAETAAFLQRYAAPGYVPTPPAQFPDVPVGHNFFPAIDWATDNGVIRGYSDGTFKPGRNVTRGEVASLIYRLSGEKHQAPSVSSFKDMSAGTAHYEAVSWLNSRGLMNGYTDGTIRPTKFISRAEFSAILYRYYKYKS